MLAQKREQLSYEDYVKQFHAGNVDSRNRPAVAFSSFCGAMEAVLPNLERAEQAKITGKGFEYVTNELRQTLAALDVCNSYGAADTLRNETSLVAATTDVVRMLKRMNGKGEAFQQFIMECIRCGATLLHLGHQLAEWTSAVADLEAFGKAVHRPTEQMAAAEFKVFKETEGNKKRKRQSFERYMAHALATRSTRHRGTSSQSAPIDFSTL